MKKLKICLLSVIIMVCAFCLSLGGYQIAVASKTDEYTTEISYDIIEFIETTDYLEEDGVHVKSGQTVIQRSWIVSWFKESFGVRFNSKFESNAWDQQANGLHVAFGAMDVYFKLNEECDLNISIYDRTWDSMRQLIQTATIKNFDSTIMHKWEVNRVFTSSVADEGYAMRLYLDDVLVVGDKAVAHLENTAESFGGIGNDYKNMSIKNTTGVDGTFFSTYQTALEFEEEKNIWDVAELNGDLYLFTTAGRTVEPTTAKVGTDLLPVENKIGEVQWTLDAWTVSSGFAFEMKAKTPWKTGYDLLNFEIGSSDIRINYNANTKQLTANVINWWPTQSGERLFKDALGGEHVLAENYNSTEWHTWKVVRVLATNADGFAVRFYIDGELKLEVYDPFSLAFKVLDNNGNAVYANMQRNEGDAKAGHSCDLTNHSGSELAVRSLLDYPAYVDGERYTDILEFGGDRALQSEQGKTFSNGEYVINTPYVANSCEEWVTENNGIAFSFKSAKNWINGFDSLQIILGATDLRVNCENGKLTFYIYNWAHSFGVWGGKIDGAFDIDFTQWNTLKVVRLKDKFGSGEYGELGVKTKVYLNGELLFTHIQPSGGMWSWEWRTIQVYNRNTGVDVAFRTTNTEQIEFEDLTVKDLPDLPASDRVNYAEDGLHGIGARATINNTERIINSIWVEEFASISNGGQFILRSEEPWRTSGSWKNLVELTQEELDAIVDEDFVQGVKEGKYYEENGVKYKFVTGEWTSDWKDDKGNVLADAWEFPNYWSGDNNSRAYYKDKDGAQSKLLKDEQDIAYRYQLHIDFGIMKIMFKLTPEENLIIRVESKYSGGISVEKMLTDENGKPIVFKTGKDQAGNYYEHTFKIARVRAKNKVGFATMVWLDGMQIVNDYIPGPMGGTEDWSHFLIDNLTGRKLTAVSVKKLQDYKLEYADSFNIYAREDYSEANWQKIVEIKTQAEEQIFAEKTVLLKNLSEISKQTHIKLSAIWTIEEEERFKSMQTNYKSALTAYVNGNSYESAEQTKIDNLLNQAFVDIEASELNFSCLDLLYTEYFDLISAIPTASQMQEVRQARSQAKQDISSYVQSVSVNDYTQENYSQFATISARYLTLIDASDDATLIHELALLAISEMQEIESKDLALLKQAKAQAKQTLSTYKNQDDYLTDDWYVIQTIVRSACMEIDKAVSQEEIALIVANTKVRMDTVST